MDKHCLIEYSGFRIGSKGKQNMEEIWEPVSEYQRKRLRLKIENSQKTLKMSKNKGAW